MFTVQVERYPIAPTVDFLRREIVFTSRHRSPRAAARRLASLIRCRTRLACEIAAAVGGTVRSDGGIGGGHAGIYSIVTPDGAAMSLLAFKRLYLARPKQLELAL